jgi:acetyl esterase/lipase
MMSKKFLLYLGLLLSTSVEAQEFIPLWPEGQKPNWNGRPVTDSLFNERIWRVGMPGIYAFPVAKAENRGTSVIIFPGGGYERLSHVYNGFNFAKWFNAHGINAFVLLYRLPHQKDLKNGQTGPLTDAQRAVKVLRASAAKWSLDKNKIGVMGISAGGHVATTLATYADDVSSIKDSLDAVSSRPDFTILLSPVVTMGAYAHKGSKKLFLGADTAAATIRRFSNEQQVTAATPPSFLVHAQNDSSVNVRNSLYYFTALIEKGVQASLHVFPQGGHGIGLFDNPGSTDLWLDLLYHWLKEQGFVSPKKTK